MNDKDLHFFAGVIIAFSSLILSVAILPLYCAMFVPILVAVLAGVLKEAFDQLRYGGWDWLDLCETVLGSAIVQLPVTMIGLITISFTVR